MSMQKLTCEQCGTVVSIEKFSEAHTSIQWHDNADMCPSIAAENRSLGDPARSCIPLRESIDNAVLSRNLRESTIELPGADALTVLE